MHDQPIIASDEPRQLSLLVGGRCRRCAERLPGGVALRGGACPACGTSAAQTPDDRGFVQALLEARARNRTWVAVLVSAGVVFLGGWLPGLAPLVLLGAYVWVQVALVRPVARLLPVRRRLVATWTVRLASAALFATTVSVVELMTLLPFIGAIGKSAATAAQVGGLAWWARHYLVWQARREGRGQRVAWWEYALLVVIGGLLVLGAVAMLWAAFWVSARLGALVGGADALAAAGPRLSSDGLGLASTIGLGAATGTRAALFLLVSGVVALVHPAWAPAQLQFLGTPAGLGIGLALLVVESATERDDDLQALFGLAAGGARVAAAAVLGVLASGQPPSTTQALLAGAAGAGAALAAAGSRHWLHGLLRQVETEAFSPRRWANRLEEGGVAGLAVAVYAGPILALGVVVAGLVATLLAGLAAKQVDARWRRPCPGCSRTIRVEASGCPRCGAEVPVVRTALDQAVAAAGTRFQTALAAGQATAARAAGLLTGDQPPPLDRPPPRPPPL
ncbi:MAG: DUF4126 family protein [Anaeromyxobacter sp.]